MSALSRARQRRTGPGLSATAFHARAGVRVTTADAYLRPGAERTG